MTMTMTLITVCERHEIEEIIGKEIKRAYDLYPLGFEATVEIKSEVTGVYGLPHYVDLKVKVCPTKHAPAWWSLRLRSAFPQPQKYQRQKRILRPPPRR